MGVSLSGFGDVEICSLRNAFINDYFSVGVNWDYFFSLVGCPAEVKHSGRAVCGVDNTKFLIPAGTLRQCCGMGQSALPGFGTCSTPGTSQVPNHREKMVMGLQNHFALFFRISDFDFPKRFWSECCVSVQKFCQCVHVWVSFCFCKSHQALLCRTGLCFPGKTIPGSLCLSVEAVGVFLLPVVLVLGLLSLAQEGAPASCCFQGLCREMEWEIMPRRGMGACISAEQTSDGSRPGWTCGFWTPEVGKADQKPGEGSSAPILLPGDPKDADEPLLPVCDAAVEHGAQMPCKH